MTAGCEGLYFRYFRKSFLQFKELVDHCNIDFDYGDIIKEITRMKMKNSVNHFKF